MKDIKGFEDLYAVCCDGTIVSKVKNSVRKTFLHPIGKYMVISLNKNGKQYNKKVHRLVAEAFIPNINGLPEVNHIDGNKQNNFPWNLEWVSHLDNMKHAFNTELIKNPAAKLNENQIDEIRNLKGKLTQLQISEIYNISRGHVSNIQLNKSWNTKS